VYGVGQPDLHPGTKYPIGAVFVSKGWVHPPLIGGDIGCGMAWYKTKLSRNQVDGDKGRKVAEKLRGLEGTWRSQVDREQWLNDDKGSCSAGEEWDAALGTIGAGNHFAEIQVVEQSSSPELHENEVILLVHSGSRGYGGSILKKYVEESHVSFEEDSKKMEAYMEEHDQACRWAKANRDLIAVRFLSCLEPGEETWEIGRNVSNAKHVGRDAISQAKANIHERTVVDIWHNNVERVKWPPTPPCISSSPATTSDLEESPQQEHDDVYIHRKGAAPTYNSSTSLPLTLLPLPGSRGTPTLILMPTFSAATSWGAKNALSLAHGAGRSMSRAKALSSLGHKYKGQNLLEPGLTNGNGDKNGEGTWVICDEKDLVYEEAPEAYKDVHAVGEDLVREGVAEVVGWCRARVSYKVRNEAR
jgi:RNA-splicing ligase RtcB